MAAPNVGRMAGRFASRAKNFHRTGAFHHRPRPPPRFSFESQSVKYFPSNISVRRELVSMLPLHNATASSRLVSLISGGSDSLECVFLKYVSLDNFRPLQQSNGRWWLKKQTKELK